MEVSQSILGIEYEQFNPFVAIQQLPQDGQWLSEFPFIPKQMLRNVMTKIEEGYWA
jgi:hypothetical protein